MEWIFIIVAILFIAFAPKPKLENARSANFGDFQIPRSNYGDPAGLLWGTVMQQSPLTMWFGDYNPIPITKKQSTGMFSSQRVIVGYKYNIGIDMLLAMGPGVVLKKWEAGTKLVWQGTLSAQTDLNINLPDLFGGETERGGMVGLATFYPGAVDATQDPYLLSKLDANVPAYNGFARLLLKGFYVGTSSNLEPYKFEIQRLTRGLSELYSVLPNGLDVNPMEVAYDVITGKRARFGNTPSDLDLPSFIAAAKTLYDENIGMSLLVQASMSGKDILEEVMRMADGMIYQDPETAKMVVKLVREDYDVSTLLHIDENNIKSVGNFAKTTWENTYNQCRVTFKDRSMNYDDSVATQDDFGNINFQQKVRESKLSMPACTEAAVAQKLAARGLCRINVPLVKLDITTTRVTQGLRPGMCFIVSWPDLGIDSMVMRVSKIDFGELVDSAITISAVQDLFSADVATYSPPHATYYEPTNTDPSPVLVRRLFPAPYFLSAKPGETPGALSAYGRMYAVAVAPSVMSVGYDSLLSLDNFVTSPNESSDTAIYNGGGQLTAAYSATAGGLDRYDDTGFTVKNIASAAIAGLMNYTTLAEARDGSAMLIVNDELFIYVGFINHGDNSVTFPKLYRGVLDTAPAAHAINDLVFFISGADGLLNTTVVNATQTYIKFLDKTPTGRLPVSAAPTLPGYYGDRAARPLPVEFVRINNSQTPLPVPVSAANVTLSWANRSRIDPQIKVFMDTTSVREENTTTRIRYSMGAGPETVLTSTGNTISIPLTTAGVLNVKIDTAYGSTPIYSTVVETISVTIT